AQALARRASTHPNQGDCVMAELVTVAGASNRSVKMNRHGLKSIAGMVAIGLIASAVGAGRAAAEEPAQTIKIATLAPAGSSWMRLFKEWAADIEKRAPGVKIKFFAGGVAGDERDAVRKMRLGQIQGAAVTAIGLGLIQPEVRVLDVPFLFRGYDE